MKNIFYEWGEVMKLKEVPFKEIYNAGLTITVFENKKEILSYFVGNLLEKLSELTEKEVKDVNIYIDTFVIRL